MKFMSQPPVATYQARHNLRLESMLIVLERAGQDLERSTKRFAVANDGLQKHLTDESWRGRYDAVADALQMSSARAKVLADNLQAK